MRDATGLLTIERDGVIDRRLVKLGAGTSTIDVPIKEGYGPNVYASVMLVKGRSGKGSRGLPLMRMGMTTLAVDTEAKRLKVAVTTDRDSYRPGDPVTAELRVTDAAGKPVQAEVALAAADEGVLTLIAFKTPDPLATFFAPWGLGVTTATQYERLAHLPEPGEDRYATGGDAGAPGTFRSRFLATAYWNPAIETDADGHAKVTFAAARQPDRVPPDGRRRRRGRALRLRASAGSPCASRCSCSARCRASSTSATRPAAACWSSTTPASPAPPSSTRRSPARACTRARTRRSRSPPAAASR